MATKTELDTQFLDLQSRLQAIENKKDISAMQAELQKLESTSAESDFWQDQFKAQKVMREVGRLRREIEVVETLRSSLENVKTELAELNESDDELLQLVAGELDSAGKDIDKLELLTFLARKYDSGDAILSIHAGQGGTEACDWTEILLRMYLRYAANMGWDTKVVDELKGTEAGLASVTIEIHGDYAYGYLKHEHGTHRLVRNSPFNAAGLRQTSFAGVEVMPVITDDIDINLKSEDIEFSATRSSGPGGQNVNKVATAVRLVHKPSGLTVTSSTSRSQADNRETAMNLLRAKLFQIEEEKRQKEQSDLKGEYKVAAWGNQIRNYVMQPYKLVKDVRTGIETAQADRVLDGDLQEFIDAEVRTL